MKLLFVILIFGVQVFFFKDLLFPNQNEVIEIDNLLCTCPDARIMKGENYLKQITPDSLKQYNFDYSEIYLTGNAPKIVDPFFTTPIQISGEIIGKKRVYVNALWNPLFKVEDSISVNFIPLRRNAIIIFLLLQLIFIVWKRKWVFGSKN